MSFSPPREFCITNVSLHRLHKNTVYRYTGKHWNPHSTRSVWETEWIRKTHGDFYTAAIRLNDRLETVITKYTPFG